MLINRPLHRRSSLGSCPMSDSVRASTHQPLIDSDLPTRWDDLEDRVGRILDECGFQVEVGTLVKSARGSVEFDVYAQDHSAGIPITLAVECKLWRRPVHQGEVLKFRTALADVGANLGFVVSSKGFQSGAHEAAAYTNVKLVTWEDFQRTFAERWCQNFMLDVIRKESQPLVDRTQGIGPLVELFHSPKETHAPVMAATEKHRTIGQFTRAVLWFDGAIASGEPTLRPPLRSFLEGQFDRWSSLPEDVLDAPALRPLLGALVHHFRQAALDFDIAFGVATTESPAG